MKFKQPGFVMREGAGILVIETLEQLTMHNAKLRSFNSRHDEALRG